MRSIEAADTSPFDRETEYKNGENNFHMVQSILAWLTRSKLTVRVIVDRH